MDYVLGADIGTSAVKVVLLSRKGEIAATATSEYSLSTPKPLWAEQNPEDWWTGFVRACKKLLEQSGVNSYDILGVGLSGQMHGLVLLDKDKQVLRPAILWNDQRTGEQCSGVTAQIGFDQLLELTGNPVLPGFTLPKLLWVSEKEPEIYVRARHFLLPKDYIRFRLTGTLATDVSDASGTALFDVKKRSWSEPMFKALGLNMDMAPPCHESQLVCGNITDGAASQTGLPQGMPVVAGAGDQAAGALGVGCVDPGQVSAVLGTSGVVFAPTDKAAIDPQGRLHTFCHAVPGTWHMMGVMLSAAGSLRWYRDVLGQLCGELSFEQLIEKAASAPAGSDGLLFLPYLSGERTPHPDPLARGAFVGLALRHKQQHMIRSVLEGVAFGLLDSLALIREQGVSPNQIRVSGGGAKSELWRSILADVFDTEVVTVNIAEGAALGACLLAGVGSGIFDDVRQACVKVVRPSSAASPKPERAEMYRRMFSTYRQLYPALKSSFAAMGEGN